jgi:hypothetical protein
MQWKEVVTAALLGSERQPLTPPSPDNPIAALLAGLDWGDPEGALLGAAAALALYQRAGQVPTTLPIDTPADALESATLDYTIPPPCEADELPRCSTRAATHLMLMLNGQYTEVLTEWLDAATATRQRVPEESLPRLLEMGRTRTDLREHLLPVLGKRGQWLAQQNPDWEYASTAMHGEVWLPDDETVTALWETSTKAARIALLRQVRTRSPERARTLLQSTWAQEKAEDRGAFLSVLQDRLSMEDEPWLETCLDDRSQHVRRLAADLLACLPESRLSREMRERVVPLLTFRRGVLTGKGKLAVVLPEECDRAMQRDGIEPEPPKVLPEEYYRAMQRDGIENVKLGLKAWWLLQMLAIIPPAFWCQQWESTPADLVQAVKGHAWEQPLLDGWVRATNRHQDADWAAALLGEWSKRLGDGVVSMLLNALPFERREAFVLQQLAAGRGLHKNNHALITLLTHCRHPWSAELTRAFLAALRGYIATDEAKNMYWQLHASIKEITRSLAPTLADEAATGWPVDTAGWLRWEAAINDMTALLQFRHDMLHELGALEHAAGTTTA